MKEQKLVETRCIGKNWRDEYSDLTTRCSGYIIGNKGMRAGMLHCELKWGILPQLSLTCGLTRTSRRRYRGGDRTGAERHINKNGDGRFESSVPAK